MRRSESWVHNLVQQGVFMKVGKLPAVISSGTSKRSVAPKKSRKELNSFVVGKSILGEGDVI